MTFLTWASVGSPGLSRVYAVKIVTQIGPISSTLHYDGLGTTGDDRYSGHGCLLQELPAKTKPIKQYCLSLKLILLSG